MILIARIKERDLKKIFSGRSLVIGLNDDEAFPCHRGLLVAESSGFR
jgi:hypothetical protein